MNTNAIARIDELIEGLRRDADRIRIRVRRLVEAVANDATQLHSRVTTVGPEHANVTPLVSRMQQVVEAKAELDRVLEQLGTLESVRSLATA